MKRLFVTSSFLLAVLLLVSLTSNAQAKKEIKKEVTLNGELVDLASFVTSGKKLDAEGLTKSAKNGNPIGFFDTKSKKLYLVGAREMDKGVSETLLQYAGMRVFITGKVFSKYGMNVIIMSDIGKSIK